MSLAEPYLSELLLGHLETGAQQCLPPKVTLKVEIKKYRGLRAGAGIGWVQEILGVIGRKTIPGLGAGVPVPGWQGAGRRSEADAILWNTDGCFQSEGWMEEPRNITAAQVKSCQMSAAFREREEHDSGVRLSVASTAGSEAAPQ